MTQAPAPVREPPLQTWSRWHALAILLALAVCRSERAAWPSALVAGPSFVILGIASRRALTPSGRFGLANSTTSLRLGLALFLTASQALLPTRAVAALVAGILLLDLLDGWLARARGDASAFGAHFDMETDALLVLVVTLRLWLIEGYGVWVLAAGVLRYAYVLSVWLAPGTGREAPRSLLGRAAFSTLMVGLLGGLLLRGRYGASCVALGTLAVSCSFARSFYYSHRAS